MHRRSEACVGGLAGNESDAFIERKVTRMRNASHRPVCRGNGARRCILDERPAHSLTHEVRVNEEVVQHTSTRSRIDDYGEPNQCPTLPDRYAYPAFSDGLRRDAEYVRMRVKVDVVPLPDIRRSPMQRGQLALLKGLRISDLHVPGRRRVSHQPAAVTLLRYATRSDRTPSAPLRARSGRIWSAPCDEPDARLRRAKRKCPRSCARRCSCSSKPGTVSLRCEMPAWPTKQAPSLHRLGGSPGGLFASCRVRSSGGL
jgi:hypothetical protein